MPESAFSLQIMPNDQVGSAEALELGHCNNQSHKIIYQRLDERDAADLSLTLAMSLDQVEAHRL